jgi:hypothetical protein
VLTEEQKKNKSKYAPVRDADVPSNPVILPCQYTVRKMKSGEYCELFYFTNNGLKEASCSTFSADTDTLVMMTSMDGSHKWIPAGAARDPKAHVLKDENLSWEQFNEAAPHMIGLMKENDWPEDRVDMHVAFWSALQNHCWCHAFDTHKQCALLLYQAQQRHRWHLSVGSSNSWSLARINQDLLDEVHEEVFKQFRVQQLAMILQVRVLLSLVYFSSLTTPALSYPTPSPFHTRQTPPTPLGIMSKPRHHAPPLGLDGLSPCTAHIIPMPRPPCAPYHPSQHIACPKNQYHDVSLPVPAPHCSPPDIIHAQSTGQLRRQRAEMLPLTLQ